MAEELIKYSIQDGVGHLILNRPEKINSLTSTMGSALIEVFRSAQNDDTVRAILLRGEGKGFCAGQDLSEFPELLAPNAPPTDLGKQIDRMYNPLVLAIRGLEKPVVCAVHGVAAGAGATLALCADIVVAAKDASFIQAFAKIGLIPDSAGTFFLPRLVGLARATALSMLAEKVSGEEAARIGMIYKAFEPGELVSSATSLAKTLAEQPTRAFGLMKKAFNQSYSNTLEEQLLLEREYQSAAGFTADFKEGIRAFLEKRAPKFTGK